MRFADYYQGNQPRLQELAGTIDERTMLGLGRLVVSQATLEAVCRVEEGQYDIDPTVWLEGGHQEDADMPDLGRAARLAYLLLGGDDEVAQTQLADLIHARRQSFLEVGVGCPGAVRDAWVDDNPMAPFGRVEMRRVLEGHGRRPDGNEDLTFTFADIRGQHMGSFHEAVRDDGAVVHRVALVTIGGLVRHVQHWSVPTDRVLPRFAWEQIDLDTIPPAPQELAGLQRILAP